MFINSLGIDAFVSVAKNLLSRKDCRIRDCRSRDETRSGLGLNVIKADCHEDCESDELQTSRRPFLL